VQEKYELWSRLLRDSGRDIVFQASWPDYVEDQDHAVAGSLPNNTDLWYKVGAQAHEFRFYSDVTPSWNAILDIANTAHEWNMARFHRPGSWAFMDMLEAGVTDKNGEKTVFWSHLYTKTIVLPTQARDKHRENSNSDRCLRERLPQLRRVTQPRGAVGAHGAAVAPRA
jgi:hypothetical protein